MKTPIGLFDLFDHAIADELGVEVEVFIDTIDKFDDDDQKYIIETILDGTFNKEAPAEDIYKAKELFKTKL